MGGISRSGTAQFQSGVLPPEMFVQLSLGELKMYHEYWRVVKEKYGIAVDEKVIAPHRDAVTGVCCVLRCHFIPTGKLMQDLPPLPYQLVPAREASDLWSFGLVVYTLCSNGRPLFPTNFRSGHLLDYGQIAGWNADKASSTIYEHVQDPLAQDFLLRVLSSYEMRSTLSMGALLSHPLFTKKDQMVSTIQRTIDIRSSECLAHRRRAEKEVIYHSEEEWLRERSVSLNCWDFDLHARIQFSSSELIRKLLASDTLVPRIPFAFILLPYKLARGKTGRLTPVTKLNVEQAERMGVQLLALSKACHFASLVEKAVSAAGDGSHKWSSSEITVAMSLSSEHFSLLEAELTDLAAKHVEIFRDDPTAVARRIVQERIKDLLACFREAGKAFFYFVDEFDCVPAVGAGDSLYPHEVEEAKKEEMLLTGLPFMHMSVLYARAVSGSVAGLVKLIFEGAYPHIPPSWQVASEGLAHVLDGVALTKEVNVLRESLAELRKTKISQGIDDIRFVHDFALAFDFRRNFANLMCVKSAGASLWTLERGTEKLKEMAQSCQFHEALESKSAMQQEIQNQASRIAELEASLEKMEFRVEHKLAMPHGI
jgi:serine/threonine protein kinase